MDRSRHKNSPSSERFLGSFLPSAAAGDQPGSAAFELDEDDLFASGAGSPERPQPSRRPLILSAVRAANPSPLPRLRRPPEGILDALPERRSPFSPPPSSSSNSSTTASPAAAAAAPPRLIPTIPRPAAALAPHIPQSAPVNVPVAQFRRLSVEALMDKAEDDDDDDEEMLPPHEMVARARARDSPMTTFSVLEGAGRTLKGRDLRQCSHGVWQLSEELEPGTADRMPPVVL
ncbi:protein S40-7 isoform X1 [Oryza sativa Japonica Group]|uniref:protein S40-7 isoform X1 n=2 Tax=Oryza TaxID=4527 RepID=UPI00000A857B|nr:rab-like protein 6 isoform X1 [Oryza sativa Japonica Group]